MNNVQASAWPSEGQARPEWLGQTGSHRWPYGHFLLDGRRRILDLNQAAKRILDPGDALQVVDGCLVACREADQRSLSLAWSDADGGAGTPVRWRTIRRPVGAPLCIRFHPISRDRPFDAQDGAPRVVADVVDLQPRDQDVEHILSFIDELTPAQTRIVAALLRGHDVTEVAQQLSISVNTVKSHLRQVFLKTGASRLSELILMLVLPFIVLPEA